MSYRLASPPGFERRLRRFLRSHPELKSRLANVLRDLATDPAQPHLGLHGLRGELEGLQAVRLTYSYRLVIHVDGAESVITLLDVGSHDDVYR